MANIFISMVIGFILFLFGAELYLGFENEPKFEVCKNKGGVLYTDNKENFLNKGRHGFCIKNYDILYIVPLEGLF